MNTHLVSIVKRISAQYGQDILGDPARLKSLFSDLAKDEPKPLRLAFGRSLEAGAYNALKAAPDAAERASRKAAIARRLRDDHGLDISLCAEALDILEAALYGTAQAASTAPPPSQQPQSYGNQPSYRTQAPPGTAPAPVVGMPVPPLAPAAAAAKKHAPRNALIAAGLLLAVIAGAALYRRHQQNLAAAAHRIIELDENVHIIFTRLENHDSSRRETLALTMRDIQDVQQFIRENYSMDYVLRNIQKAQQYFTEHFPDFDFGKAGYIIDDYRNKQILQSCNEQPQFASLYLSGIEKMAGCSSVYAKVAISNQKDGKDVLGYWFAIDEEYSDRSGIEWYSSPLPILAGTSGSDTIKIFQKKYTDAQEYYWIIFWEEGVSARDKTAMLTSFLTKLRRAKVFGTLDLVWLMNIYTGIAANQRIGDMPDW
jgi:hypothetical protein